MKISQIAVTLYTVRDFCKNAADLAVTARNIHSIGYGAVQLSGLGPIPPEEIVRIMAGEGLTICATHEPSAVILDEPERAIGNLQQLGCRLTAYPYPQGIDFSDAQSIAALVRKLDTAGAKFSAAGLTLGYHNHDIEFLRFQGATVLDYIYAQSNPRNLVAELDTYWVQYGGMSPLHWTRTLGEQLVSLHLKDYGVPNKQGEAPFMTEVGAGNLDFPPIVAEAERNGCEWFIVEQDFTPSDPFDSLERSFEYIVTDLIH